MGHHVKAIYWFADSGFPISDIDSTVFTHIFCGFAELDPNTNELVISPDQQDSFSTFTTTVQQKNPAVKTLISIGGGGISFADYATMASQPWARTSFIQSSIKLARTYGFHGLDLDWEYPSDSTEMTNYGILVDEWRAAVAAESRGSGTRREALLLTAAVSFGPRVYGQTSYPYPSVARSFDWINVMAYDFYSPTRDTDGALTRAHAALYDPNSSVSGSSGIRDWIQAGVPANKLVLGIPFYGYGWELVNPDDHGLLAPANGPAGPGDSTFEYNVVRSFIAQNRAAMDFDPDVVTNYCYADTTWIGYDDTESVKAKVVYVKSNALRGYFAWHVGADDHGELAGAASQAWDGA